MSPRDPFAFLDAESPARKTLLLLLAILKKQGGQIELSLDDLTAIDDGASLYKYPSDTGTSLVLRYARRGAEAYFLTATEESPSPSPKSRRAVTVPPTPDESPASPLPPSTRHAIHDDIDLALREEEMATRAKAAQRQRVQEARREAGAMPWTTRQ